MFLPNINFHLSVSTERVLASINGDEGVRLNHPACTSPPVATLASSPSTTASALLPGKRLIIWEGLWSRAGESREKRIIIDRKKEKKKSNALDWDLRGLGFPGSSDSKESACSVGDLGLIPALGRSTGEGNGKPLQCSCLENPMDRGAWQVIVHEIARVRHNLVTKPPPNSGLTSFYISITMIL